MKIKIKRRKHRRKKTRVRMLFLVLLGAAIIAYVSTRFTGCAEYAFFHYNPSYYEPRDLERDEVVKEGVEMMLEMSLEEVEQEKAQKYLKYKDTVQTEEHVEQEKRKLQETLKKMEEEGRHKTIWEEQR